MDGCREERVDPDPVREIGVGRGSLDADADERKADGAAETVIHQDIKSKVVQDQQVPKP
jgi:hypothetical protein